MPLSRRKAIQISGGALAGLSVTPLTGDSMHAAHAAQATAEPWPDSLVERPLRAGFPAPPPYDDPRRFCSAT